MTTALFLGGARSGKSRLAESYALELAKKSKLPLVYLATAQALDEEMQERIAKHRHSRSSIFTTVEEPLEVADWLKRQSQPQVVLLDCLSLLFSNWLCQEQQLAKRSAELLQVLKNLEFPWIVVSNEVGLGIVPADPLTREYRDELGWFHQEIATFADHVYFTMAGIPVDLKVWQAHLFS